MRKLLNKSNDSENIDNTINNDDINTIMSNKGYCIGFNGYSKDFNTTLKSLNNALNEAQGLYIKFIINDKITMSSIGDVMEQLNNYLNFRT